MKTNDSIVFTHVVRCYHFDNSTCHFVSKEKAMEHAEKFGGKYVGTYNVTLNKYDDIIKQFKKINTEPNLDINNLIFDPKLISVGIVPIGSVESEDDAKCIMHYLRHLNRRKFVESEIAK